MTIVKIITSLIIISVYVGLVKIIIEEIKDSIKEINTTKENNKDRAKIGWSTDDSYKQEYVNIIIYSFLLTLCVIYLFPIFAYIF